MQTTRKQVGLLIILIGIIIILLIVYFAFWKGQPLSTGPSQPVATTTTTGQLPGGQTTGTTTPSDQPVNYQVYDPNREPTHQINGNDLMKIGMSFAARFGSYSNQSDYGNFTDLKIMMTDNMKSWVDTYITQLKSQSAGNGAYYGVTTQAVTATVSSFDDKAETAAIIVTTKQVANTDKVTGGASSIKKLDLNFKKVNGDWLVDRAYWEK